MCRGDAAAVRRWSKVCAAAAETRLRIAGLWLGGPPLDDPVGRQVWRGRGGGAVYATPPPTIVCDGRGDARQERSEGMGRRGLAVRDREAGPGGQGDAEAWDVGVSRSGETGTPGWEHRQGRAVGGPGR